MLCDPVIATYENYTNLWSLFIRVMRSKWCDSHILPPKGVNYSFHLGRRATINMRHGGTGYQEGLPGGQGRYPKP
jgi:hypothetical protein